jgi:hypothetical protein
MYTILLLTAVVAAQDGKSGDQLAAEKQQAQWRDEVSHVATAKVRRLNVTVGADPAVAALLRTESLLRWSNPTVGTIFGEVFMWTVEGRPVAIGSIYHRYDRPWGWNLELVSTSVSPLRATEDQATLWHAESAGVALRPFPNAPPPSPKPATRLGQMRKLAERFSTELADGRNEEEVTRQLRLLSQPLYRYSTRQDGVVDGALFAVVEGTDPELWIMLEAIDDADKAVWQYALARMDSWPMRVRLDGEIVQTWDKVEKPWAQRKAPYTVVPFPPGVATDKPTSELE